MKQLTITANIAEVGTAFTPFWSTCVGAGRANEGLRADWQSQLRFVKEHCGFRYIRFHGLFHEDMCILSPEKPGSYSFQYIDSLFDSLLKIGVRPFVELGFCPAALASGDKIQFWWKSNITPPKDMGEWCALVKAVVTHWVERYGLVEVRTWYFEVWNEPNLCSFWDGTKADYFALYRASVQAVKSVDKYLRVGGPATSNFVPDSRFDGEVEDVTRHRTFQTEDIDVLDWHGVWIEDFLWFCAEENLPVDFVSCHPYPTDFAFDDQNIMGGKTRKVGSLLDDIIWLRRVVAESSYPNAEIHLTEWSSSPTSRDYSHDYLPAAAYVVRCALAGLGMANSLSYWVFTDIFEEQAGGPEAFHGGFGMVNAQGIPKPVFHAYRMLNALTGSILAKETYGVVTMDGNGKIAALLIHYPDKIATAPSISLYPDSTVAKEIQDAGFDAEFVLRLNGMQDGCQFMVETLDVEHGAVIAMWEELGRPANLTPQQTELLTSAAWATKKQIIDGLELRITAKPWAVILVKQL